MHAGGFPQDVSEVRRSFHSILEFATRAVAVTIRSASAIGFPGRDGAKRHVHSRLEVCGRRLPVADRSPAPKALASKCQLDRSEVKALNFAIEQWPSVRDGLVVRIVV